MNQFKVLVAEANPLVGVNIQAVLQRFGLVCKLLNSHDEVIPALQEQSYDVVVMDSDTDQVNYEEIIQGIRSMKSDRQEQIPVLALTSNTDNENIDSIKAQGFNDFIIKPLDLSDLKLKLANNIRQFSPIWDDDSEEVSSKEIQNDDSYNLNSLIEYAGGDMDFVNELIRYFIDESPKVIEGLKNAHQKGNWDDLRMIAHKYNPQMSVMGLNKCASILTTIEANTGSGVDLQDMPDLIYKFEILCKAAIEYLNRELENKRTEAYRVLVCEDDLMMLKLIEHKMLKAGFEIIVAKDGKDAAGAISSPMVHYETRNHSPGQHNSICSHFLFLPAGQLPAHLMDSSQGSGQWFFEIHHIPPVASVSVLS